MANPKVLANSCCDKHSPAARSKRIRDGVHSTRGSVAQHLLHENRQSRRFTIAPDVQVEVLDRLLELNHERYAEEIRQGLHTKKNASVKRATTPVQSTRSLF